MCDAKPPEAEKFLNFSCWFDAIDHDFLHDALVVYVLVLAVCAKNIRLNIDFARTSCKPSFLDFPSLA